MPLIYTAPDGVSNTEPDESLFLFPLASLLASQLGGIVLSLVPSGYTVTYVAADGTKSPWTINDPGYYAVTVDPKVYWGVYTPIPVVELVKQGWSSASKGQWHVAANGQPQWVATPVQPTPLPIPTPTPVVFPGFGPGSGIGGSTPLESSTEQKIDQIIRMLANAGLKDPGK